MQLNQLCSEQRGAMDKSLTSQGEPHFSSGEWGQVWSDAEKNKWAGGGSGQEHAGSEGVGVW